MVRRAAPRWCSSLPRAGASIPTPKSKPSKTKKTTQHSTTRANHSVARSIGFSSSVTRRGTGGVQVFGHVRRNRVGTEVLANQIEHQADPDHGKHPVEHGEADQGSRHLRGGQSRGRSEARRVGKEE